MSKLYRSRRDRKLFGVCGGLAETFNIDSTLLRLVVVVTAFFSAGTVILLYLIAAAVIPNEPTFNRFDYPQQDSYGYGASSYGGIPPQGGYTSYRTESSRSELDDMMRDVEMKALKKEIEQLKAKLAEYEKGEK